MAEYSRMAKGNFTAASGQTSAVVLLPFQPDYVEVWNYTNIKTSGASLVTRAWWDNKLFDGSNNPTMIEGYSSGTATIFDVIQTNGISPFYAGLGQQYGTTQQVIGITKANPAVVNVTAHGYNVGDTVILQGIATGVTNNDFRLINSIPFTITAVGDANHFTLKWDSSGSNYTAISGSPTGALVKKVLYPFLYVPQDNVVSFVTTGVTTTVATTMYHNFEVGQEIAFRIPALWGTTQLNSLPNNVIPGQSVYGYVVSITDNWTFVCNINSTGYTAFTVNPATPVPGNFTLPQVVPVGDVSSGGLSLYVAGSNGFLTTSPLYPPPNFPTSTNRVPTIGGPAIKGAFVNNTSQGFIIGAGAPTVITGTTIVTSSSQIYYHAYLHDIGLP
jgi:hypothetical protein